MPTILLSSCWWIVVTSTSTLRIYRLGWVNRYWRSIGYQIPATGVGDVLAIQFHVEETDVDNSLSELAFIVKDELLDHRGAENGVADLDGAPYTEYVRDGEIHRVYFATDASRNVLFYTTATGNFSGHCFFRIQDLSPAAFFCG